MHIERKNDWRIKDQNSLQANKKMQIVLSSLAIPKHIPPKLYEQTKFANYQFQRTMKECIWRNKYWSKYIYSCKLYKIAQNSIESSMFLAFVYMSTKLFITKNLNPIHIQWHIDQHNYPLQVQPCKYFLGSTYACIVVSIAKWLWALWHLQVIIMLLVIQVHSK
jgi:hypothetical protein